MSVKRADFAVFSLRLLLNEGGEQRTFTSERAPPRGGTLAVAMCMNNESDR